MAIAAANSRRIAGACGPLSITVTTDDPALAHIASAYFDLYSRRWTAMSRHVEVHLVRAGVAALECGNYLRCGRMQVDRRGAHYLAVTRCSFVALGTCNDGRGDRWIVAVPPQTVFHEPEIGEMEDIFSLICTIAWRAEGWTAVHAGAVMKGQTCALLCAASGGGKSTLTAALVANGWQTLGDDKLLLRIREGLPFLASVLQTFNLDPGTSRWFDVGDIEGLPRYSAWTQKRRVHVDRIGNGLAAESARPTHLICLVRSSGVNGMRVSKLDDAAVLPALLRQIVIPSDREAARSILQTAISCARTMQGLQLEIGDDAYARSGWLAAIEDAIA